VVLQPWTWPYAGAADWTDRVVGAAVAPAVADAAVLTCSSVGWRLAIRSVHKDLVLAGSPAEAAAADAAATCRRGELEAAAAAGFVWLRAEPGRTAPGGRCGSCSGDAVVAAGDAVAAAEGVGVAAAVVEWSQE